MRIALPLLVAWILGVPASPAAAYSPFAEPVRHVQSPGPAAMTRWTGPDGRNFLVILDRARDLHFFDLAVPEPWKSATVVDADGAPEDDDGTYAGAIRFADVDHDGRDDAIVMSRSVFLLLGRPGGGFSTPFAVGLRSDIPNIAVGDIDGDGLVDIGVMDYGGSFTYCPGRGDGRFRPAIAAPGLAGVYVLAGHDANGDGTVDLVAWQPAADRVVLMTNDGHGTFAPGAVTPLDGFDVGSHIAVTRIDADDFPDLVLTGRPAGSPADTRVLAVRRGIGGGAFGAASSSPLVGMPEAQTMDIDGDGRSELVHHRNELTAIRFDASGAPGPMESLGWTGGSGPAFRHDWDGDGEPDLLAGGGGILRLLTAADAHRLPIEPPIDLGDAEHFFLADLTGDGIEDFVGWTGFYRPILGEVLPIPVPGGTPIPSAIVFRPRGPGGVVGPATVLTDTLRTGSVRAADIEGDGDEDLVVIGSDGFFFGTSWVVVWTNDGHGNFTRSALWPAVYEDRQEAILIDLGADGRDELLTWRNSSGVGALEVWHWEADGRPVMDNSVEFSTYIERLQPYDLDGDAHQDFLLFSTGLWRLHGRPNGTFDVEGPEATPRESFLAGDWLGDADFELAAIGYRRLELFDRVEGEWEFARSIDVPWDVVSAILTPDLNGDDRPDILISDSYFDGRRWLLLSEPVRGFSPPFPFVAPESFDSMTLADIDADGRPDLLGLGSDGRLHQRRGLPPPSFDPVRLELSADDWTVRLDWELGALPPGHIEFRRRHVGLSPDPWVTFGRMVAAPGNGSFVDTGIGEPGRYEYGLFHADSDGYSPLLATGTIRVTPLPAPFRLLSARPSPGAGPFEITFEATTAGLAVFDIIAPTGRRVRHFEREIPAPTRGTLTWDGRDDGGAPLPSGVYFAREARSGATLRLVIVR